MFYAEPSPNGITPNHTPYGIQANYGFLHVYAVTMTLGILASILYSFLKLKQKKVPFEPVILSVLFIVPAGLLGGSFLGKINGEGNGINAGGVPWYGCFAFWKAGMSIHGAVIFGMAAGMFYYAFVAKKYQTSLWVFADAILPNVLLGQIIGRWGNFFNHELLGDPVSYSSLSWLPGFIRDNCWKWAGGSPETNMYGHIIFRQPIFLYESFFNFWIWCFITFGCPNIGKLIGPKPYQKHKNIKYSFKTNMVCFFTRKPLPKNYYSYKQMWNQAFNMQQPSLLQIQQYQKANPHSLNQANNPFALNKGLHKLYNPDRYWIPAVGFEAGCYLFGYNLLRFILETKRQADSELFIMYNRPLDYGVLLGFAALGLVLIALFEFVWRPYFRKVGRVYEKKYIDKRKISNWQHDYYWKTIPSQSPNITSEQLVKKYTAQLLLGFHKNQNFVFDKYFTFHFETGKPQQEAKSRLFWKYKLIPSDLARQELHIKKTYEVMIDFRIPLTKMFKLNWFGTYSIDYDDNFDTCLNNAISKRIKQILYKKLRFWYEENDSRYHQPWSKMLDFDQKRWENFVANKEQIKLKLELNSFKTPNSQFLLLKSKKLLMRKPRL